MFVSCRSAPWRCREAPLRSDGQIGLFQTQKGTLIKILITLNTRRPSGHRYRLFGTDGGAEWFAEEKVCRRFDPASVGPGERDAWEVVPIGVAAPDDDATAGHGGTDLKMARHFVRTVLEGLASPIDVYRAIEYALPGILAARSANLGGMPIEIPDLRREPFEGTSFWETLSLPETEPPGTPYRGLA